MAQPADSADHLIFVELSPIARRLLWHLFSIGSRRLSIKDVATQLNFSSEFYFSQFFRHRSGMSPTQFRQHLKG